MRASWWSISGVLVAVVVWICVWNMKLSLAPLSGDALCFVPAVKSLVAGQGMRNPIYSPTLVVDAGDPTRLNWHGVVAPHLWAFLTCEPTYQGVKNAGVLVSISGLVFFALGILRHSLRHHGRDWRLIVLPAVVVLGSGWLFEFNGRPESVASMIAALVVLILPAQVGWLWLTIVGCGLGAVVATTPAAGLLMTPLVILFLALRSPKERLIGGIAWLGSVALLVCIGLVEWLGYGVVEWLKAMQLHGQTVLLQNAGGKLVSYWLFLTDSPLLLLAVIALISSLFLSRGFHGQNQSLLNRIVLAASVVLLCGAAYIALIKIATNYYNVLPVMVCLIAIATHGVIVVSESRKLTWLLVMAAMIPSTLALARSSLVLRVAHLQGVPFQRAVGMLSDDLSSLGPLAEKVCLGHSLVELFDTRAFFNRTVGIGHGLREGDGCFVLQQAYMGVTQPPELPGLSVVVNRFVPVVPSIFGFPIARSTGAYGYAIYTKAQSKSPAN